MKLFVPLFAGVTLLLSACVSTTDLETSAEPLSQSPSPDRTFYGMDSADGFGVVTRDGAQVNDPDLTARDGILRFDYKRKGLPILAHYKPMLTDMEELRLRVRMEKGSTLLFALEDRDGDKFNVATKIETDGFQTLVIRPSDLQPDKDAKNKKQKVDPARLGIGYGLADLSSPLLQRGSGSIEIEAVDIRYAPLADLDGPLKVTETIQLSDDVRVNGDIDIAEGGVLRITANRAALAGDIRIAGGTLVIEGGVLRVPSRFAHERNWRLTKGGRVVFKNAHVTLDHGVEVDGFGTSSFEMDQTVTRGLFTVTTNDRASAILDGAEGGGEFIMCASCPFRSTRSKAFLLWLVVGPEFSEKMVLSFPNGKQVAAWKAPAPRLIMIEDSSDVLWGLITAPGARGTVRNSDLTALASVFGGPGETRIKNIHTGQVPEGGVLDTGDRSIRFESTGVRAWNFYTTGGHRLVIEDSTIGESWGLDGSGEVIIRRSTVDGSGGTLRARGKTLYRIEHSRVTPQVIAEGDARMSFVNSHIENSLSVVDRAEVQLDNTTVSGALQVAPSALVIGHPTEGTVLSGY